MKKLFLALLLVIVSAPVFAATENVSVSSKEEATKVVEQEAATEAKTAAAASPVLGCVSE